MATELLEKQRKLLLFTAKSLYKAEMYDQAMISFKQAIDMDTRLTPKYRTFFNNLVQALINPIRAALKHIKEATIREGEKVKSISDDIKIIGAAQLEKLKYLCHDILSIVDQQLIPGNNDAETRVDLMRLQADLYRYIVEFSEDEQKKFYCSRAAAVYDDAYKLAQQRLPPHSLTRLALVLNRSILLADYQGRIADAVDFVEAEVTLLSQENTELSEASYQQAMIFSRTLNKQLLKWKK